VVHCGARLLRLRAVRPCSSTHGRLSRRRIPPRNRWSGRRGRPGRDRGDAALQLVLVIPLFVTVLLAIAQVVFWWFGVEAARTAGRQAVQDARLYGTADPAGTATARARAALGQLGHVHRPAVTATTTADLVTITVRGHADAVLPGLPVSITVHASAVRERLHP